MALGLWLALGGSSAIGADDGSDVVLPDGARLREIDFQRHVMPLITRFGCNAANCHGSFQGRGGFRLSLFGHGGAKDLQALRERVDLDSPEDSLLLIKPSLREKHGGGQRFKIDSWSYQVLLAWIREGTPASRKSNGGALQAIVVTPGTLSFEKPEANATLVVEARFQDAPSETVTALSRFESQNSAIADVTADGHVNALRPGATHIVVTYAGGVATVPVTIPYLTDPATADGTTTTSPTVEDPSRGFIDAVIESQLKRLNLPSAAAADDTQFLRRATLDTLGRPPTAEEIRQFLSDCDPKKRAEAIDRLLADPQHASLWATRLCDLTGCRLETMEGPEERKPLRARMWHEWFRRRLKDGMPFDEIVRGVISGTSRDGTSAEEYLDREAALIRAAKAGNAGEYWRRHSLDLFYRRASVDGVYPREDLAERSAAAFLGIRIQCARCHIHPHDRWTQGDYAGFVNIFADVTFGSSTELNQAVFARLAEQRRQRAEGQSITPLPRIQEVYDDPQLGRRLLDPESGVIARPRPLGGPELDSSADTRTALADWLTSAENRQFARNWVNRIWAHYFGRGLVEPVDGFSASNPPSHPDLVGRLATEFVRSRFDMRHIERLILTSEVYQRSSMPVTALHDGDRYYASAPVRPLMAETLVQSLDQILKSSATWTPDVPAGGTLFDVAANRPSDARLAYLFELFGRGDRESVCDCDRTTQPSLRQTLHLMSDAVWIEQIQKSRLIDELLAETDDKRAVQNVVLQALSRFPSPDEEELFLGHLNGADDRRTGWIDIVWALVNSQEFRTNH